MCKCKGFLRYLKNATPGAAALLEMATSDQMMRLVDLSCENGMFDMAEGLLEHDKVDTVRASAMIKLAWRRYIKRIAPTEYKEHRQASDRLARWPLLVFVPLILFGVYAFVI